VITAVSFSLIARLRREETPKSLSDKGAVGSRISSFLYLLNCLASSSDSTSSSGGNKTDLLSTWGVSSGSGWVTHMLMVTTTMGMLDGVHSDTSNSWPISLLCLCFIVSSVGLEEGLVSSLSTGTDADHTSAGSLDGFPDTGWESDSGLLTIFGVTNDDSGGTGSSSKSSTVSLFGFNIGADSSLGHGGDWENVADGQGCFGSSVDELSAVHAFNGDEKLSVLLEFVLISEHNLCKRSASAWVVNDVLHDSLDVTSTLSEVQCSETCWCNSMMGVGLENSAASTSLGYGNERKISLRFRQIWATYL